MNDNPDTFAWASANSILRRIFGTRKDANETNINGEKTLKHIFNK